MNSTICAISTPYGSGGLAVVRVSGSDAIKIVDSLYKGRKPLSAAGGHTVHFGRIEREGEVLDEVLCTVFRAPHSFTGEQTVEIACHGSLYIQQQLIQWLIDAGCRAAEPGEFTRRAFLQGKIDLTQAEAVADLIAAQDKEEKDLALSQLRGSVSNELSILREKLLHFASLIELELDFADHEELEFADRTELTALTDEITTKLKALIDSFQTGNAIRNGVSVAIIGSPNVGKSTLLNALLGEQRAIVSDEQGTTRDTVEDSIVIDGILFRFIDTAGLRKTKNRVEKLGIARSRKAANNAHIIIRVMEKGIKNAPLQPKSSQHVIRVYNKADLLTPELRAKITDGLCLSAQQGEIAPLREELVRIARENRHTEAVMLSNARHYEAVCRAHKAILRVKSGLKYHLSGEFLSLDLQDCLLALGEVTGQITSTEILTNIFSKFCIGK